MEAVVREQNGRCELSYLQNGTLLDRVILATGRGIAALEDALRQRTVLKSHGWQEWSSV